MIALPGNLARTFLASDNDEHEYQVELHNDYCEARADRARCTVYGKMIFRLSDGRLVNWLRKGEYRVLSDDGDFVVESCDPLAV